MRRGSLVPVVCLVLIASAAPALAAQTNSPNGVESIRVIVQLRSDGPSPRGSGRPDRRTVRRPSRGRLRVRFQGFRCRIAPGCHRRVGSQPQRGGDHPRPDRGVDRRGRTPPPGTTGSKPIWCRAVRSPPPPPTVPPPRPAPTWTSPLSTRGSTRTPTSTSCSGPSATCWGCVATARGSTTTATAPTWPVLPPLSTTTSGSWGSPRGPGSGR